MKYAIIEDPGIYEYSFSSDLIFTKVKEEPSNSNWIRVEDGNWFAYGTSPQDLVLAMINPVMFGIIKELIIKAKTNLSDSSSA